MNLKDELAEACKAALRAYQADPNCWTHKRCIELLEYAGKAGLFDAASAGGERGVTLPIPGLFDSDKAKAVSARLDELTKSSAIQAAVAGGTALDSFLAQRDAGGSLTDTQRETLDLYRNASGSDVVRGPTIDLADAQPTVEADLAVTVSSGPRRPFGPSAWTNQPHCDRTKLP